MSSPTDEKLLRDYLDGRESSFELLVRRHSQELHRFVLRFTGDYVAAEDVVQEAFIQVHRSAGQFDLSRRFKPWLFTIAANKARDHLRRVNRRREVPFEAPLNKSEGSGQRFIDLVASDDVLPHEDLDLEERKRLIRRILDAMPAKSADVLILAYFHRFPYRDIAEITGVPLGTVKSRLHAAIVHFGERYRRALAQVTDEHGKS